jgi:hypothetical protein
MEEWWEFKLALFLAPLDLGSVFPLLWWFRTIWFWSPVLSAFWILEWGFQDLSLKRILLYPGWILFLLLLVQLISGLSIPHPPCQFLKIQEVMAHGHYFCPAEGGLPETHSFLLSGSLAFFWHSGFVMAQKSLRLLLLIPLFLSTIASVLLVQAFVSDILTGLVLGILLTFVVRNLRKRARHVHN